MEDDKLNIFYGLKVCLSNGLNCTFQSLSQLFKTVASDRVAPDLEPWQPVAGSGASMWLSVAGVAVAGVAVAGEVVEAVAGEVV